MEDEQTSKHCWPTPWLEAAMHAGFAHHKGGGEWVFINDKMRDMLVDFGNALQVIERERCAAIADKMKMGMPGHTSPHPVFLYRGDVANAIRDSA